MSIEEKYDEIRQLINIGKEKGYLLYEEVNEYLPAEIASSDELDDLFHVLGTHGIEIVDADPLLADHPNLLDEVRLLFTADDEAFLFKS